jgi:hypothetical protein
MTPFELILLKSSRILLLFDLVDLLFTRFKVHRSVGNGIFENDGHAYSVLNLHALRHRSGSGRLA